MKDGGDNLRHVGQRLTGEDDWRIGTDYTKKDQSPYSNQFQYRLGQCDRHLCSGYKKEKKTMNKQ